MKRVNQIIIKRLAQINLRYLPFADAATVDLPLSRLLRLALFQISVGMMSVLLLGTLNRVMIVELGVSAGLVAVMVALPFLFAPLRAFIGFKSDVHRSAFGWRRVPYLWIGTMLQFGGLAIMPFALLILSGDGHGPIIFGHIGAALAFLLVGAGLHTTQTAGLALATDLAQPATRPRVVALMYVALLVGMIVSGMFFSTLLSDFSALRLIQVIQGAAVATVVLNVVAMWKQEARHSAPIFDKATPVDFQTAWAAFASNRQAYRFLLAVGLGTTAFNMQDIILEPYGAEVLKMTVGATTLLTALLATGSLMAFAVAARALATRFDPIRLAALGVLSGLAAFPAVIFAGALGSAPLFWAGVFLIGFGGGLFAVSTLTMAMGFETNGLTGLAVGAWGSVQATTAGVAIASGGLIRDVVSMFGKSAWEGSVFAAPSMAYSVIYSIEIILLFATLAALGPLVRRENLALYQKPSPATAGLGLAEIPS
jgi:MFS transporter, BCD family, chlorophyll transporter